MKRVPVIIGHFRRFGMKRLGLLMAALVIGLSMWIAQPAKAAVAYRGVNTIDNGTGSTSLTLSPPASSATGDVLVVEIGIRDTTIGVISPPSGWTTVIVARDALNTSGTVGVYTHVYSLGEPSYVFNFSVSQKAAGIIVGYSGVDTVQPVDVSALGTYTSTKTMSAPSVTTTQANTMLVGLYMSATGTTFTPGSSMTLRGEATSSGGGNASSKVTVGLQDILQASVAASGPKTMTAGTAAFSVGALLALRPAPVVSQASYRFFQNTDSTTASTPYAATGTSASIPAGMPFRLRLNLGVSNSSSSMTNTTGRNFTLQYAVRGSDNTCDTSFTNEIYTDVTTSSVVRYYDNPTPADGAAYVTSANDPARSGITAVGQKYAESSPLNVGTNVLGNQDALWDIALTTNGASPGQTYCLRVLDASTLNSRVVLNGGYSSMPEFSIPTPLFTQANYRWLTNTNSTTPGVPLASQDVAMTAPAQGVPFRLRSLMRVDGAAIAPSYGNFVLQYAQKSGTCDTGFIGESYANVNPVNSKSSYSGNSFLDTGTGTLAWTAYSDAWGPPNDGFWATVSDTTPGTFYSNWLRTNSYSLAVPANAVIKGIEVSVLAEGQGGVGTYLDKINLSRAGVVESTGKSDATPLSSGFGWYTYGGPTDLWGASWTPADINDYGFGAAVSVKFANGTGDSSSVDVDTAYITVYYTIPGAALFQYYDNPSVASSTATSSTANDPADGARVIVPQGYNETDPFANTSTISAGQDGLWDFPIVNVSAPEGTSYCFRIIKSDGSLLNAYTSIPELITPLSSSGPTLDQQLRGGQSVLGGTKGKFTW